MRGRLADTNSAIRAKICWRSVGTNSAMQAHVCLYVCAHIFAASKPSHWQATLRNSSSARPLAGPHGPEAQSAPCAMLQGGRQHLGPEGHPSSTCKNSARLKRRTTNVASATSITHRATHRYNTIFVRTYVDHSDLLYALHEEKRKATP